MGHGQAPGVHPMITMIVREISLIVAFRALNDAHR